MSKIDQKSRTILTDILERLINVINMIIDKDDFYILQENKKKVVQWLLYLNEHDDKEDLRILQFEITDNLLYQFGENLSTLELDGIRVDLMYEYIEESDKILNEFV